MINPPKITREDFPLKLPRTIYPPLKSSNFEQNFKRTQHHALLHKGLFCERPIILTSIVRLTIISNHYQETRMHSSGMRTARLLTISQHALWPGRVPAWRGTCPGGCTCWGEYMPGGTWPGGGLPRWVPAWGVSCDLSHHAFDVTCMLTPHLLSVSTCAAPYSVTQVLAGIHPPNRMTDRCKNITLPQTSFAVGKNREISQHFNDTVKYPSPPAALQSLTWMIISLFKLRFQILSLKLAIKRGSTATTNVQLSLWSNAYFIYWHFSAFLRRHIEAVEASGVGEPVAYLLSLRGDGAGRVDDTCLQTGGEIHQRLRE